MQPRSSQKQPMYGLKTVELTRGRSGYGFTIFGEKPCSLGGIVKDSAADRAGLGIGDQVISINGYDVSRAAHDDVIRHIGLSHGTLTLEILQRHTNSSDEESSDSELEYLNQSIKQSMPDRMRPPPLGEYNVGYNQKPAWQKYGRAFQQPIRNNIIEHIFGPVEDQEGYREPADKQKQAAVAASQLKSDYSVKPRRKEGSNRHHVKHTVVTREARLGSEWTRQFDKPLPVRSSPDGSLCNCHEDSFLHYDDLQVIVSYSGSVEMPSNAPRLAGSRLQSIRAAVQRLRGGRRMSRSLVLMDINADGIRLVDSSRYSVAHYLTECIAFCGLCPDDRRFFGIVISPAADENVRNSSHGSSCHVFMVDPELSNHRVHVATAAQFGINCTMDLDTDCCLEFPSSAAPVIGFLGRLYRQRKVASGSGYFAPLSNVLNNASTTASACVSSVRNDRACVVEMSKPNDTESLERSFIHNLSVISPDSCAENSLNDSPVSLEMNDCLDNHQVQATGLHTSLLSTSNVTSPLDRLNPRAIIDTRNPNQAQFSNTDDLRCSTRRAVKSGQVKESLMKSLKNSTKTQSSSPCIMPPPQLPPRHGFLRSSSDRSSSRSGLQRVSPVPATAKVNSAGQRKAASSSDSTDIDEKVRLSGSTKPPLPERRPIPPRPGYSNRYPVVAKKEMAVRPKSTPPVNACKELSVAASIEGSNYDSDPGEDLPEAKEQELLWSKKEVMTKSGTQKIHSGESFPAANNDEFSMNKAEVNAVSCKALTKVGNDNCQAASWAIHFDRLLSDVAGIATFLEFLQKEYSAENLAFWTKCEEYKKLSSVDLVIRKTLMAEIVKSHFADGCSEPVNVDGVVREEVMKNLTHCSLDLFDMSQKQIYQLMKQDSYPRFLKSDIYKQAVIAQMEGKPLPCATMSASKSQTAASGKQMKKSRSSTTTDDATEEKRRKSLLPWHRNKVDKKHAKSNESSELQKKLMNIGLKDDMISCPTDVALQSVEGTDYCKVKLVDGSFVTIPISAGRTVNEMLLGLGDRLHPGLDFYDVICSETDKVVSLTSDAAVLASKEVQLVRCSVMRLDLPGQRQPVAIRARAHKTLYNVVEPILLKHDLRLQDVVFHIVGTGGILNEETSMASLDGKHVLAQSLEEVKGSKKKKDTLLAGAASKPPPLMLRQKSSSSLSACITSAHQIKTLFGSELRNSCQNVVFDELGVWCPDKVGESKQKPEEGQGRQSGLFSFMRRSSIGDKKNGKPDVAQPGPVTTASSVAVVSSAPSQSSVSSHLNGNEHKMFELLKRVQNRQYDDQRGTSLNAFKEMPDFLRLPDDAETLSEKVANDRLKNEEFNIEICRRDVSDNEDGGQLVLSPSRVCAQDFCDELDSIIPSNDNAERYFSQIERCSSPDFNDSRLMEGSLCDIGMDSSGKAGSRHGWSLVGSIASNPSAAKTTVFSSRFPTSVSSELSDSFHHTLAPPQVVSAFHVPSSGVDTAPGSTKVAERSRVLDVRIGGNRSDSSCSTPSPTTHDLLFENGDCVVSKILPKTGRSEDCDLVYGIV